MAPRKRRHSTRRTAGLNPRLRLGLIAGANLVALAVLWQLVVAGPPRGPASGEVMAGARSTGAGVAQAGPAVPGLAPAPAPAWLATDAGTQLARDLERIVERWIERARAETKNKAHRDNVAVGVHVRELGAGPHAEIGFGSQRSMRPASNMKLVTTAAALVLLGPDWRFETPFEAGGPLEDGVLRGDLIVRAGGDPLFAPEAEDPGELLVPVVAGLRQLGVRSIAGDLVLDERNFIEPGPGPEWPDPGQHWTEYCALSGGFSVNRGALKVSVQPAAVGQEARITVQPSFHGLPETLGVRTTKGGNIAVAMHARPTGVLVRGTIPASARDWTDEMAHPDPVELFGHVLAGALAEGGVLLEGRVRRERGVAPGRPLTRLTSDWLPLLRPINTDSTNAAADQLFLATGYAVRGEGSREASAAATAEALLRLGVSPEGLVQVDGSGLSRANRVTAAQMTALIEAVLSGDPGSAEAYVQSLALAGETGTLDDRMRKGPARGRVRAKTGFIDGTSALSGVAHSSSGRSFVFSVLVNYPALGGLNRTCWKPMQDEICERLVESAP